MNSAQDSSSSAGRQQYLERLFGLSGQVALITGARQGIGRAIAHGLARAGAHIVTTSRDPRSLGTLATELDELGAEHLELELDLADDKAIAEVAHAASARWSRLDVLVNNAGLSIRRAALEYSLIEWDAVLTTNLRGPFLMSCAAARAMNPRGGRIINLSSTFARTPAANRAPYAASKAALEQLTRVLALEWASHGITVNAVAPTTILTESREALFADEAEKQARIQRIPLGRLGNPEDIVGAVLLLASSAGSFITGEVILVDGGFALGPGICSRSRRVIDG